MTRRCRAPRERGATLVELMVALAVMAIVAGVAGLAFVTRAPVPTVDDDRAAVSRGRDAAMATGRPQLVWLGAEAGARRRVTALPDGRVIGAPADSIDTLTGEASSATR